MRARHALIATLFVATLALTGCRKKPEMVEVHRRYELRLQAIDALTREPVEDATILIDDGRKSTRRSTNEEGLVYVGAPYKWYVDGSLPERMRPTTFADGTTAVPDEFNVIAEAPGYRPRKMRFLRIEFQYSYLTFAGEARRRPIPVGGEPSASTTELDVLPARRRAVQRHRATV